MWPGIKSRRDAICGLSLLLVLSFAPRGFSPGTPVFPSPQKPAFSKFQFDQESGRRRTTLWMYYLQIIIYLFISSLLPRCLKFVQVVAANIYEPLAPQA